MDLFEDLPEPGTGNTGTNIKLNGKSGTVFKPSAVAGPEVSASLYDDLPTHSITKATQPSGSTESGKRKHEEFSKGDEVKNGTGKKQKSVVYELESYIVERQGEREDMQDAHIIIKDFAAQIPDLHPSIYRVSLYGVFDGHGGVRASRFASENLHKNLRDKFPKGDTVEKEIRKAFIDAFKKTDEDFLKLASKSKPVWKDGTTAILVLVVNEAMYIANIGDSQAVLCRYKEDSSSCVPVPLSVPHNPSLYDERMRIQKQGGHVKDGRVMGVLEVSRSIGDGQYKKLGVICTPDVKKCALTDNDRYVIIACDGLWKCFEPEDSIKFANKILQNSDGSSMDETKERSKYDMLCNKLANEAVLRFSGDNVTVLVLAIHRRRWSQLMQQPI